MTAFNATITTPEYSGARPQGLTLTDNIYDRVGFMLHNAIRGDPDATVRSILSPTSLTAREHRTLADSILGPDNTGLAAGVIRTATNPLVLIGAALAWKFPIANPTTLAKATTKLEKYSRYIPAPLRGLLGLNEIFAGTPIPRIYHRIPAETHAFINRHFEHLNSAITDWRRLAGRTETAADQIRWGALLDGTFADPRALKAANSQISRAESWLRSTGQPGASLARLDPTSVRVTPHAADDIILSAWRQSSDGVRAEIARTPIDQQADLINFLRAKGAPVPKKGGPQWLDNYFPHVGIHDREAVQKLKVQFTDQVIGDPNVSALPMQEIAGRLSEKAGRTVTSSRLANRIGILPPSSKDLAILAESGSANIDPRIIAALEQTENFRRATTSAPASYTLRFSQAAHHYAHSMGRAVAWSVSDGGGVKFGTRPGVSLGRQFVDEIQAVRSAEVTAGGSLAKSELLRNAYLPMALGHGTFEQTMRNLEWNAARQFVYNRLDSPSLKSFIPESTLKSLRTMVETDSDIWSAKGVGRRISGYLYLSTLGGNVGSGVQNLFQQLLTTAPLIGIDNSMRGFAHVAAKAPEFAKLMRSGLSREQALTKLFPDFMARELDVAPIFDDVLATSSRSARPGGPLNTLGTPTGVVDRAKESLMSLFHGTETVNRISAFEGTRIFQAPKLGLTATQAAQHAQEVVEVSQLWSGGAALPSAVLNWWPPFRQFLSFPAKTAGILGQGLLPGGPGGPGLGLFNPGTVGRALAYSAGTYELVKATTGTDLSRSLIFGALPQSRSDSPFGVLPFVPPIMDIAGGFVADLSSGDLDFEQTRGNIPTLLPGGVAAARLVSTLSPDIAQFLGKKYPDWSRMTPDGRVPIMNPNGQLQGYSTAWDIHTGSMGIPGRFIGGEGQADEQAYFKWVLGQRDRMRDMRKDYIEAIMVDNDATRAESLNRQHIQDFGAAIQVTPEDWEAARLNLLTPRIQKIMQTLPTNVRPQFAQLSSIALSSQAERFIGVDPSMFAAPLADQRRAALLNSNSAQTGAPESQFSFAGQ